MTQELRTTDEFVRLLNDYVAALGEEHRGQLRQILDMRLEISGRTARCCSTCGDEATLPDLKRSLVEHWFASAQEMLARLDPAQNVLDKFRESLCPVFPEIMRITYRKIHGIDNGVAYGIYLVLDDATDDTKAVDIPMQIRANWRLVSRLEQKLREVDEEMQGISWHIVNASEPGPIEAILAV